MQEAIEDFLNHYSVEFKREVSLSKEDRIDFLIEGGIGVECKIKGPAMRVFRQCERYCEHDEIKCLILFTSFHMDLPPKINKKDTFIVKPGLAWL